MVIVTEKKRGRGVRIEGRTSRKERVYYREATHLKKKISLTFRWYEKQMQMDSTL